jgi:outer membrane biogenesis lipoprotein LolB
VEYDDDGRYVATTVFQLLQWRSALKLEKLGMKMSGGRKVSTHLRKLMGLKRTVPIELLQEWVNTALVHVGYEIGGEK